MLLDVDDLIVEEQEERITEVSGVKVGGKAVI